MTDLELQLFNSDAFLGGNTQPLQTHFILEETPPVPEPLTYAMLLAGLGLLGFAVRHRKETT